MRRSQIFATCCLCRRPLDSDYLSCNSWLWSVFTYEKRTTFNTVSTTAPNISVTTQYLILKCECFCSVVMFSL
ncbi:hypothetical protein B4U80_03837 [Leptotrombidium deliense]|uniref:Uncharacterized protein n=1 Tax=Leptotrombidium deliense TaxID=299467 RepID=A0A443STD3_9ACAR|nr:hypothetical protein B4U80_03837 [Leptotrombidium deliense]